MHGLTSNLGGVQPLTYLAGFLQGRYSAQHSMRRGQLFTHAFVDRKRRPKLRTFRFELQCNDRDVLDSIAAFLRESYEAKATVRLFRKKGEDRNRDVYQLRMSHRVAVIPFARDLLPFLSGSFAERVSGFLADWQEYENGKRPA